MQGFVDLEGASGDVYRFHHIGNLADLPAIAGNFVYVRGRGERKVVVCCGTDERLLNAGVRWPAAVQFHRADSVFVRRNISWKNRQLEHEDIVKSQRPAMVVAAEFERQT